MKKTLFYLSVLSGIMFFMSCSDTGTTIKEAQFFKMSEIGNSVGYLWISEEVENYQTDPALIQQISDKFNPDRHRLFCFVKPSCTCQVDQKPLAYLIKTLTEANIDESYCEIYSMKDVDYSFPYQGKITLDKLPAYLLIDIQDTSTIYSISDKIDEIKQTTPDSSIVVEKLLLEGLSM